MEKNINIVNISGKVACDPIFSHSNDGKKFFLMFVDCARLSGVLDTIPVHIDENYMKVYGIHFGENISVIGEIRTYKKTPENQEKPRTIVFAKEIYQGNESDTNVVELQGIICKEPVFRCTPFGRNVCDVYIKSIRGYGKMCYVPCITWGSTAKVASKLNVGDLVTMHGRFQSRGYEKIGEDGFIKKLTAYEVSVHNMIINSYNV